MTLAQREDLTNPWMLCSQKGGANGAFVVSKVGLAGGKPRIAISDEDEVRVGRDLECETKRGSTKATDGKCSEKY